MPPAGGNPGMVKLWQEQPRFFRKDVDIRTVSEHSARALLVRGLGNTPTVYLNGEALAGPFAPVRVDGATYLRIPIVK
ncbi:MAG: hypothetical protein BWY76_00367 [bacterium ADurb.Bin429]|nr:MAG: hypothetical protein BWY76_00367 [bacterium ADurb.Bin429]